MNTRSLKIRVQDFEPRYQREAAELVNSGLAAHFGFMDVTKNPDLYDIATNYGDDCFLLAFMGNELVGTGGFILESQSVVRVVRMHTAPSFRRRRVGSTIMRHLEDRAIQHGARELILDTDLDWDDAHAFYRATGFEEFRRNASAVRFHKML